MLPAARTFYEQPWVQQLLGESFHPGGLELSARLIDSLQLPIDAAVLDVACGVGSTTLMMARRYGLQATGVDASQNNVHVARERATDQPAVLATFLQGEAGSLPVDDAAFDAVVCECALSTFGDQARVAAEFARVLKPGGKIGLSDMCLEGQLPAELSDGIASWTCLAQARSKSAYEALLSAAGFQLMDSVDETAELLRLIADLKRKLALAGVAQAAGLLHSTGLSIGQARRLLDRMRAVAGEGVVQYRRFCFIKRHRGRSIDGAICAGRLPFPSSKPCADDLTSTRRFR